VRLTRSTGTRIVPSAAAVSTNDPALSIVAVYWLPPVKSAREDRIAAQRPVLYDGSASDRQLLEIRCAMTCLRSGPTDQCLSRHRYNRAGASSLQMSLKHFACAQAYWCRPIECSRLSILAESERMANTSVKAPPAPARRVRRSQKASYWPRPAHCCAAVPEPR